MNIVYKPQKRKTVGLYPQPGNILEVRFPAYMPREAVDAFVKRNLDWAEDALRRKNSEASAVLTRDKRLPFFGKDYPIFSPENGKAGFYPGRGFFLQDANMAEHAARAYRIAAEAFLPERTARLSKLTGLRCAGVKITSARTRWGSCNGKNGLNFSLYLMMAPVEAVDYVIIHELSHTVHHDHSAGFWALVKRNCPDYKKHEEILKNIARRRREIGL